MKPGVLAGLIMSGIYGGACIYMLIVGKIELALLFLVLSYLTDIRTRQENP